MNVLVIGAGMYVTGRGTRSFGTILPALAQVSRSVAIEGVTILATSKDNEAVVQEAARAINDRLGTSLVVRYLPLQGTVAATVRGTRFDCAIISVPDHLHFEYTKQAIELGLHCLVVKPLTPTLGEARELVRLQEAANVYAAVEFHKRYDETNLWAKRVLTDGVYGRPVYATVEYSQRIGIPLKAFRGWASRTNIFQYLGVHYVDLVHFLTGFVPVRVAAIGTRGVLAGHGVDTYDSVHATVVWRHAQRDETFVAQYTIGWIDPDTTSALSDQRFTLVCANGRLEVDQKHRGLTAVSPERGTETINPWFSEFLPDADGRLAFSGYGFKSVERFMLDVRDILHGHALPSALADVRPGLRQALVSTAVVEAVNESLRCDGEWKAIDDLSGE